MPFLDKYFGNAITDNIGVWTTEANKHAMLQAAYSYFLDGRVRVGVDAVSTGRTAFDEHADVIPFDETFAMLCEELKHFRDLPDGKISGRTAGGDLDDMGMAFLIAIYWSFCIKATTFLQEIM
jgi:hypothetical protein